MDSDPQPHNNRQFSRIFGAYSVFLWIFCAYSVFYNRVRYRLVFVREILLNGILIVCFSTSIFAPRNGIPSCFFFHGMVRNRITSVCFYFCSMERNSELFSLLWNGSEWNPRVCFYFCSTVQNSEHFSPLQKGLEQNSESFLFRGAAGIPPEQINCSLYSVFRWIFLSEIANPSADPHGPSPLFIEGTLGLFHVHKFSTVSI